MHHRPRSSKCIDCNHIAHIEDLRVTFFTHPIHVLKMKNELMPPVGGSCCVKSRVVGEE